VVLSACGVGDAVDPSSSDVDDRGANTESAETEPSDDAVVGELGELGDPAPIPTTFCDAFGAAPTRWIDDAIVPLRLWIDAYADVDDVPDDAGTPLAALRGFAERKLAWNLKQLDERPDYDASMAAHALALADSAAADCPDLPLVAGPRGFSDLPLSWADDSPDEIDRRCREHLGDLDDAIAEYVARRGAAPVHVAQVEAEAFLSFVNEEGDLFFASDFVGIGPDGSAAAVPGGACER
jgi:hypothetical protein